MQLPYIQPIDPIGFPGGAVLPVRGGRALWRFAPLAEDATPEQAAYFARYVSALRDLGHRVIVASDDSVFAAALIEELGL